MIKLLNVTKVYQDKDHPAVTALKTINLTVNNGEIFGVIGKSGAGKSTLIRCVNLLERPSSGKVFVAGNDLTAMTAKQLRLERQHIGMIFQHFNLLASKTVYENIAFPLNIAKKSKREVNNAVQQLLELTELQDKQNNYPGQLSGGQKQRVAIARALANSPKILLCDEATSSLDPQTTKAILNLLKAINEKLKLTILLITHEMDVIKQICDRVALIDRGEIIEMASIGEFFTQPQTAIAKNLINHTISQDLPIAITKRISLQAGSNKNTLLRLYFHGQASTEPLMAHLIKNIGVDINILQANIEVIKNTTLGVMTAEIIGDEEKCRAVLNYLHSKKIRSEVIGYTHHD